MSRTVRLVSRDCLGSYITYGELFEHLVGCGRIFSAIINESPCSTSPPVLPPSHKSNIQHQRATTPHPHPHFAPTFGSHLGPTLAIISPQNLSSFFFPPTQRRHRDCHISSRSNLVSQTFSIQQSSSLPLAPPLHTISLLQAPRPPQNRKWSWRRHPTRAPARLLRTKPPSPSDGRCRKTDSSR